MSSHTDKTSTLPRLDLSRWSKVPFLMMGGGLLLLAIGFLINKDHNPVRQFGFSWLLAFMFFLSIVMGSLFLVILHHLFDAHWSVPIRRFVEHISTLIFPDMMILFIPIAALAPKIYSWLTADPHMDHALHAKQALFNPTAFYLVSFALFLIWGFYTYGFRRASLAQDIDGNARYTRTMRRYAASGVFVFAFTLTLGAIYWMKSLQHQFFSTMYGVYYFAGSVWCTLATVYLLTMVLSRTGHLNAVVKRRQFYDIGVLLFAFTVFYTYIHFSQYFLIWNANVPEETFWYVLREKGTWWQIGLLIVFGHFFIPFLTLLRIDAKLSFTVMIPVCLWAWLMHFVDMSFNIMPVLHPDNFHLDAMDIGAMLFIGGLLAWRFIGKFLAHPAYPQKDPRMSETMGVYFPPADSQAASHGGPAR